MLNAILDAVFGALSREQRLLYMRLTWIGLVSFHMAWVCGWIGLTGLEAPFARASDLKVTETQLVLITAQLRQDRIDRLDQVIQTLRGLQCRTVSDSPARQNYTDRLNDLFRKYVELAGVEPHVPRCDET